MRKIDGRAYDVAMPDGKVISYEVKKSLADILLAPQLKLNGSSLLKNNILATKIIQSKEDFIFFEESEWGQLKEAVETIEGWSVPDVELIKRILEAQTVELQEKK